MEEQDSAGAGPGAPTATRQDMLRWRARTFIANDDAIIMADREGRILDWNPAAERIYGYTRAEMLGQTTAIIHPPEEHADLTQAIFAGVSERGWWSGEVAFVRRDGTRGISTTTVRPLTDADGQIVGTFGVNRDVTEDRRRERAVDARARQLETTVAAVADGLAVYDSAGSLVEWNAAVADLFEFDRMQDYTGLPVGVRPARLRVRDAQGQPMSTERLPFMRAARGETLTGPRSVDLMVTVPSGVAKLVNASAAPLRDALGQIIGAVVIYRDVTERGRLERRAHDALRGILAIAEMLLRDGDQGDGSDTAETAERDEREDGSLGWLAQPLAELARTAAGSQQVALVGLDVDQGTMRPLAMVGMSTAKAHRWREEATHGRIGDYVDEETIARLRAGELVLTDLRAHPPPGDYEHLGMLLVAPFQHGGQLAGVLVAHFADAPRGITAESEEVRLVGAIAGLVSLVLDREHLRVEREAARSQALALTETTRRMDEFLGIASHELRTPLTSASINTQLAERNLRTLLRANDAVAAGIADRSAAARRAREAAWAGKLERTQLLLQRTYQQVVRMERLVSDLLDVSRIHAGNLDLRLERCDLVSIVRDAVREQRTIWPARALLLDLPPSDTLFARADPDRIGQVVTNFATNALKYSPPDQPVTVRALARDGAIRIEVQDHGPGLTNEQRAHLFERFSRVPGIAQQSGSGVGLGLGLYICRTIVERHHGRIGVESEPGTGSTFWFSVPLEPAAAEDAPRDSG